VLKRFRQSQKRFPRQFWLLIGGSLLSSTGASMIWPFLTIYLHQRLAVPLTVVTALLTLNSAMGILASFIAGSVADRFGRKTVMVASLLAGIVYYLLMSRASSLGAFAGLMAFWGAFNPLFNVGASAMIADLIPSESRSEAYAMQRIVHNVGVAAGPIIGGFLAAFSYTAAFWGAAFTYLCFSLLVIFTLRETLAQPINTSPGKTAAIDLAPVLRNTQFIFFVASFVITNMANAIMFTLLPVYAKENFHLPESQYSFIVTVNALMVIFLQYSVTRVTRRFPALPVLSLGAVFYGIGLGSIALGSGFWSFVPGMVIMTTGELIMSPTASTLAADLAPADSRGRYMSIFGLSWPVGAGIGPVVAGFLSEQFAPAAMWYGGMAFGLLSAACFLIMSLRWSWPARQARHHPPESLSL
jgi:MFS family permease